MGLYLAAQLFIVLGLVRTAVPRAPRPGRAAAVAVRPA